jgi:hypothetical protein
MHLHNHNAIRNQIRDIGGTDYKALSAAIRGVINLLAPKGDEADIQDQTLGIENLRGAYTQWVQSRREGIRGTLWGEAMKVIAGGSTTWAQIEGEAQALRTNDKIVAFAKVFDPQPMHMDAEAAKATRVKGLTALRTKHKRSNS